MHASRPNTRFTGLNGDTGHDIRRHGLDFEAERHSRRLGGHISRLAGSDGGIISISRDEEVFGLVERVSRLYKYASVKDGRSFTQEKHTF